MLKKRLVVYVGYDSKSARFVRRIQMYRDLFDEVRIIYVPESNPEILQRMEMPAAMVEEVRA